MKLITFAAVLLTATLANAQTVTTTTVSLGGIVNCQSVTLVVNRTQNGEIHIDVSFIIRECDPNSGIPTVPTKVVANFNSPIPPTDFSTDRTGAHLITSSPYGPIKVDWTITKSSHSTYDATWTWTAPNNIRQTQNDDVQSVHAVGNIGQYLIDRNGYFTTSVVRK